ncbi:MAG: 16S rRNA (guanine(527)-N(7))-methyltransferase RsmG [Bacillota bacterium]
MAGLMEKCLDEGAADLGIELDAHSLALFVKYYQILVRENDKYNLTSIKGERETAIKHFIDSLTCLGFIGGDCAFLVDVGSGAGFPGIPIKIMVPGIKLLLVDSVKKKTDFLKLLVGELGMNGVEVRWDRAESMGLSEEFRDRADVVVSRAVAPLNVLVELCVPLVRVGGAFLAMKGPGVKEELETARRAISIMGGKVEKVERLVLPLLHEERSLVLIRKTTPSPAGYPRRPGIPAKKPLV